MKIDGLLMRMCVTSSGILVLDCGQKAESWMRQGGTGTRWQ